MPSKQAKFDDMEVSRGQASLLDRQVGASRGSVAVEEIGRL